MQYDLTLQLFRTDTGQLFGHFGEAAVRRSNQDQLGREHLPRHKRMRVTHSDGSHRFAGAGLTARHDCADLPTEIMEAPSECAPYASRTDDRKGPWHYMLG